MHPNRSTTRSASLGVAPSAVLELVSDPARLPDWAPEFAATGVPFTIRTAPDQGTVDIVVSETPRGGAFLRVLPNGGGSEVVATVIFPVPVDESVVAAQAATIDTELETIRALCGG